MVAPTTGCELASLIIVPVIVFCAKVILADKRNNDTNTIRVEVSFASIVNEFSLEMYKRHLFSKQNELFPAEKSNTFLSIPYAIYSLQVGYFQIYRKVEQLKMRE
jgi:hypothetical protein